MPSAGSRRKGFTAEEVSLSIREGVARAMNPGDYPRKPPFLPILGYVLGFMLLLGLLAFAAAALLRLF